MNKDLKYSRFLIEWQRAKSIGQRARRREKSYALRPMFYALCSMLFLYLLLAARLVTPVLADYNATWPISYEYSGAEIDWPLPASAGKRLISLNLSATVSATISVRSIATGETQITNISDIDAGGFSSAFAMDEIGEYEIREEYTLTTEIDLLPGTESFTRTDTRNYSNSAVSMVLFQMSDMHFNNFSSEISPSGTVKVDNVTPSISRPGDIVSMDIIALKNITPGERIIDSITFNTDWHKISSLIPIVDDEPPTITHSRIMEPIQAGSPVTAEVTDNLRVDSAFLYFRGASAGSFQQIGMALTDEPDTYAGYIPLNASGGWGKYYFEARDVAGNEIIYPPSPYYDILVEPIVLGDVNGNDAVDDDDATSVLRCAVGLVEFTPQQLILGDVSGDDTISSFDAGLIMQYVEGSRGTFPVVGGGLPSPGEVEVSASDTIGAPGASVTIPISISNSTGGPEIIGIDITLTYDPDILTAIGAVTGGTASGWEMAYNISNGQIIIGMANHTELNGEGAFANINFSVSEAAVGGQGSLLTLPNVSLNEGHVSADKTNGLFEVTDQIELVLHPGWNFFSTCFEIEDNQLLSVLRPIEGLWTAVWTYDANPGWRRHIYGGSDNDLHDIVPGKGYSIYMDTDTDTVLTITGTRITDANISLQQGWNLIGPKSLTPQSPEDMSFSMNYTSIWTYNGTSWLKYIVGDLSFLSNLDQLKPGWGYWVYVE